MFYVMQPQTFWKFKGQEFSSILPFSDVRIFAEPGNFAQCFRKSMKQTKADGELDRRAKRGPGKYRSKLNEKARHILKINGH